MRWVLSASRKKGHYHKGCWRFCRSRKKIYLDRGRCIGHWTSGFRSRRDIVFKFLSWFIGAADRFSGDVGFRKTRKISKFENQHEPFDKVEYPALLRLHDKSASKTRKFPRALSLNHSTELSESLSKNARSFSLRSPGTLSSSPILRLSEVPSNFWIGQKYWAIHPGNSGFKKNCCEPLFLLSKLGLQRSIKFNKIS